MDHSNHLKELDTAIVQGTIADRNGDYADRGFVGHIQNLFTLKGKSAVTNLTELRSSLGDEGEVEVLAQRYIEEDNTSVTLFSMKGTREEGRVKSLLLIARRFSEKGKVTEEEYLPISSTAEAQAYFPDTPLPAKQVKPKLSFITATRKRKSRVGRKLGIRVKDTDLHRIPRVGKTVLENFREAGVNTFQQLAEASDDVLESVRGASGRALRNFDYAYWREVGKQFVAGELTEFPAPPKARGSKTGKRSSNIDYQSLRDGDIDYLPRVGAKLLGAMHAEGIQTFADLAAADDEKLERLREPAGRPFVNFDMTYFRTAAQAVIDGSNSVPAPPAPRKAAKGPGRIAKPRNVNPNDLHVLPGVGKQMIAALHEVGINTFHDLAEADKSVLQDARSAVRGKYKNIDLGYLQRQAKYADQGRFEKLEYPVKIEKPAKAKSKDAAANFLEKLRNATGDDIGVFDGVGKVVKDSLAEQGITKITDLATASEETLRSALESAGPRFAGFRVDYWIDAAQKFIEGDLESILHKAPKKAKAPKAKGRTRKVRVRKPKDNQDLTALPDVGSTVAFEFRSAGLDTFEKIAEATDGQLTGVRANSGPRYKNFDVSYWRDVAKMAAEGNYDYPGTVAKETAARQERKQKPLDPSKLRRLPNVGQALADSLRDNGLKTWNDIVDAEAWKVMKSIDEAGKRKLSITPHELMSSAKDALNGKFPERKKRGEKEKLPEGYNDFLKLKGVGIGKTAMARLHEAGIQSYKDLSKATIAQLETVRDTMRGRVANADVRKWRDIAKLAAKSNWEAVENFGSGEPRDAKPAAGKRKRPAPRENGDDLAQIKGLRNKDAQLLRGRGVNTFAQLADLDAQRLEDYLEETGAKVKQDTATNILSQARELSGATAPKSGKASKKGAKSKKKAK